MSGWTLLGNAKGEGFTGVVSKLLGLSLPDKAVHPVYDYVGKGGKRVVVYAEVKTLKDFPASKGYSFAWFTPKEISKLPLSAQTKQDIIVGHRVIDSQIRRDAGEQTIG